METTTEKQQPYNGQLISVAHSDTIRLLEVYVKRSLSLNDGTLQDKRPKKKEKWVTMPTKKRRHSSDPSLHLAEGLKDGDIGTFAAVEPPKMQPELPPVESKKLTKKSKKKKKPSFWRGFLGLFSRKSNEDKDEEQANPSEPPETSSGEEDSVTKCLPPTAPAPPQKRKTTRRKSLKRRLSKPRISLIKPSKQELGKELNLTDIRVEGTFVTHIFSYISISIYIYM